MGLFKSADELVDKGHNFLKQGEFSKALNNFEKATEKFRKEGDVQNGENSNAFAKLLKIHSNKNDPNVYISASEALQPLGDIELKFGVRDVKASNIANECSVKAEELSILTLPTDDLSSLEKRGRELQEMGTKYQSSIGTNVMIIPEIFEKKKITGIQHAYALAAEGQENLAEAIVWSDPKKAAEYYQTAANYRRQIGEQNKEKSDTGKVQQFKKAAKCWLCGREIYGEDIHFFPMRSDITEFQRKSKESSPLPSKHESENMIYACRACHEAISKKADEIADHYHQIAIAYTNDVKDELQSQINQIERALRNLR